MDTVSIGNLEISYDRASELVMLQQQNLGDPPDIVTVDEEQAIALTEYLYKKRKADRAYAGELHSRAELELDSRRLADLLVRELPKGVGFTLFTFSFGEGGNLAYISNANREDMLRMVLEWANKMLGGGPPPDPALGGEPWSPKP